jgi:pimeloyl-ACP methyl ester carboxylesterase
MVAFNLLSFWLAVRPPRLSIPLRPEDFALRVEDVSVRADDGARLSAWLVAGDDPRGDAVIVLHGYPAEKRDMLPIAAALHPRFTVLLLDLRYFGASEGHVTTLGVRERGDLARVIDVLAARGVRSIGVFGFSLGGAVALLTAAEDDRVAAVAAYAAFADLRTLGRELYAWLWLLKYPFVEAMIGWGRLFLGVDLTRPSPAEAAARLRIPVWLLHARDDEQIPFAHAERLRAALAGNPRAEYAFVDHGRHGALPPDFDARLRDFFARAFSAGDRGRVR